MNNVVSALVILLLVATGIVGQSTGFKSLPAPTPTVPAGISKIDPAKEADIRKLLEITGARTVAVQTMNEMNKSMKPVLTNSLPAGEYRAKLVDLFFERFMAKADSQSLVDLAIPEYDRQFTHEEILGLLQFYQTPVGKKAVTVLPQLSADLQEKGRKWGQVLGRQTMIEVISEHPEFAKQIEEAQKAAQKN
jgi:hypothetical protein